MKSWTLNPYTQRGYSDRAHYLRRLASSLGLEYDFVYSLARDLGHTYDFIELPAYLDDYVFLRDYK